jgi:hypothetical protein
LKGFFISPWRLGKNMKVLELIYRKASGRYYARCNRIRHFVWQWLIYEKFRTNHAGIFDCSDYYVGGYCNILHHILLLRSLDHSSKIKAMATFLLILAGLVCFAIFYKSIDFFDTI